MNEAETTTITAETLFAKEGRWKVLVTIQHYGTTAEQIEVLLNAQEILCIKNNDFFTSGWRGNGDVNLEAIAAACDFITE